jgi:hypothetical protein
MENELRRGGKGGGSEAAMPNRIRAAFVTATDRGDTPGRRE